MSTAISIYNLFVNFNDSRIVLFFAPIIYYKLICNLLQNCVSSNDVMMTKNIRRKIEGITLSHKEKVAEWLIWESWFSHLSVKHVVCWRKNSSIFFLISWCQSANRSVIGVDIIICHLGTVKFHSSFFIILSVLCFYAYEPF